MRMLELEASGFGAQSTSPLTQVSVSLEESAGTYNRQSSSPLLLSKFLLCFAQKFSESLVRHPLSQTYLGCDLVELTSQIFIVFINPFTYRPAQFYQGLLQLNSLVELLSGPLLLSCEEPPCSKSGPSGARRTLPPLFASVTTCISSVVSQWTISLST